MALRYFLSGSLQKMFETTDYKIKSKFFSSMAYKTSMVWLPCPLPTSVFYSVADKQTELSTHSELLGLS